MLDGILLPANACPVSGFLIVTGAPLRVKAEKSPPNSAAVGTTNVLCCGWLSTYFSPANQKNVLFLTIGPPTPPPPLRQYSGTFGCPCTLGINSSLTNLSGRKTVSPDP